MHKFYQPIDKRSRKALAEYLEGHFRYNTMNSWNQSTSYACNMKIYNLGLESSITNKLYDLIRTDEFFEPLQDLMRDFDSNHNYEWQVGMNGRSGGYLVLYQGGRKPSGYKSYCTACGQRNYTTVTETGNICGLCRAPARTDYRTTPMQTFTYPGRGTDMYEEFEDWPMWQLRDRVDLVQDLDRLADAMVQEALYMANNFSVEEETIFIPKQQTVLVPNA